MADVIIKGMEMPTSCHECVAGYGGCCFVAPPEADGICPDHGRADFCPLVPVPPHGRLIDADAAENYAYDELEVSCSYLSPREASRNMQLIYRNMPTIIPAEEGET